MTDANDISPRTIPDLLLEAVARTPRSRCLAWREAGYWRSLSSEEVVRDVRRLALGLYELGLRPGDTVGITGPSSPHWVIADLAVLSLGAVTVPLFPNLADEHAAHEIAHSRCSALIALGAEGWALAARHRRHVRLVVTRGPVERQRGVHEWSEVCAHGDRLSDSDPALLPRLRTAVRPDALATIIYTSGSTGMPKGVELTHANLLSQVHGALQAFPLDPATDCALSCLPLAHIFERMVGLAYIAAGVPVWFADDIRQAGMLMREVRPTITTMVPRLAEKIYDRIAQGIDQAWVGRRALGRWAMKQATTSDPELRRPVGLRLSDSLVWQRVRSALGGRLRCVIVGGAALEPRFERFLRNIGVPVYTGYGLTEASPVVAVNCFAARRSGTVGRLFPGVEVRIGVHDEILVRGPGVMRGYHRDPAATGTAIDCDGWLHTGDCGRFDRDGFLTITGRIKELFKTANGKYVCPIPIEQELAHERAIDHACVIAEGRPYVTALFFLTPEEAARHAPGGQPDAGLTAALDRTVAEANAHLDNWQQVRRWAVVPAPATIGRELTPTLKLRRTAVAERWHDLIDTLYPHGGGSWMQTTKGAAAPRKP